MGSLRSGTQKLLIEEKTQELEERNLLLIKARNAIESLQADLEMAQAETEEVRRSSAANRQVAEKERALKVQEDRIRELEVQDLSHLKELTDTNAAIRDLEIQLKASKAEVEAYAHKSRALQDEVKSLQDDLTGARTREDRDRDVGAELRRREEECAALRVEVEKLHEAEVLHAEEAAKQRDREQTLVQQAEEVAKLEAEEISRLEVELAQAREDQSFGEATRRELAKQLDEKTQLLRETTATLEALDKVGSALKELGAAS